MQTYKVGDAEFAQGPRTSLILTSQATSPSFTFHRVASAKFSMRLPPFPLAESSIPPSIMHLKVLGHNIEELRPQGERTQHRLEKSPLARQLTRVHFLNSGV